MDLGKWIINGLILFLAATLLYAGAWILPAIGAAIGGVVGIYKGFQLSVSPEKSWVKSLAEEVFGYILIGGLSGLFFVLTGAMLLFFYYSITGAATNPWTYMIP